MGVDGDADKGSTSGGQRKQGWSALDPANSLLMRVQATPGDLHSPAPLRSSELEWKAKG